MYVGLFLKNKYLYGLIIFAASLLAAFALPAMSSGQSGQRDCDSNAVIHCGALTTSELKQKFRANRSVRVIFSSLGVNSSEINAMNSNNTKHGVVTKDGRVIVNGDVVATDSMTAGRQNMPGSQKVTRDGVTFFKRPPSASFAQDRLDALVVMRDGQFKFAVITSCGNAVKAVPKKKPEKPVVREVPKPQPTPPAPAPAAPVQQQQQQQQQQQAVIVQEQPVQVVEKEVPAPAPAPVPAPAPPPAPAPQPQGKELPEAGPGEVVGISALVGIGSTVWYMVYGRLRNLFM